MKRKFNKGKPFHGQQVRGGKLVGATGLTDYFYFQCPSCSSSLRVCDAEYSVGGVVNLKLSCTDCKLVDFTKICVDGEV